MTIETEDPALAALRQEIEDAIAERRERGESKPFDEAVVERIEEKWRERLSDRR